MKHPKRGPTNPLLPNDSEYCTVGDKKKRRYKTKLDAELSAPTHELQQYICPYCGTWHNGSVNTAKNN
ncbi:MAG TPA: hypothetical protein PLZ58_03655 [Candidatus Saccharibacteria bacterium]|nr:hypothetical protein [Candidatus Saccharibacteria bacterium]HRQ06830.1 hypothetical protein [Candidatus Saccharibacteria bacterium]